MMGLYHIKDSTRNHTVIVKINRILEFFNGYHREDGIDGRGKNHLQK
jgi:hypothetical protein